MTKKIIVVSLIVKLFCLAGIILLFFLKKPISIITLVTIVVILFVNNTINKLFKFDNEKIPEFKDDIAGPVPDAPDGDAAAATAAEKARENNKMYEELSNFTTIFNLYTSIIHTYFRDNDKFKNLWLYPNNLVSIITFLFTYFSLSKNYNTIFGPDKSITILQYIYLVLLILLILINIVLPIFLFKNTEDIIKYSINNTFGSYLIGLIFGITIFFLIYSINKSYLYYKKKLTKNDLIDNDGVYYYTNSK